MSSRSSYLQPALALFSVFFLFGTFSVAEERIPMTNERLEKLLHKEFGEKRVEGQNGVWRIMLSEDDEKDDTKDTEEVTDDAGEFSDVFLRDEEAGGDDEGTDAEADPNGGDDEKDAEDAEDADDEDAEPAPGTSVAERMPPVMVVLTDSRADRMRMMMPIRRFDPNKPEDLKLSLIALHCNYDRALDARYALKDGVLWSVFIHPLESLTDGDLKNGLDQVRALRKNTGTSFTSSALLFGGKPKKEEMPDFD